MDRTGTGTVITARPIAFAAPMVRAVLAGRKTQTRRVVTPQPKRVSAAGGRGLVCRYGSPGERLWVRERFGFRRQLLDPGAAPSGQVLYAADDEAKRYNGSRAWRQSRYMPRAVSRIVLEITVCRAERLNRITRADALAEGFDPSDDHPDDPVGWFRELWDHLNRDAGYGWDANPWVWVVEFRLLD